MRVLGLRNITTVRYPDNSTNWEYLIFYDIDTDKILSPPELSFIRSVMQKVGSSYVIFSTKHGFHVWGLTAVDAPTWALAFSALKNRFRSYYSGQVLRVSRKPRENQKMVVAKLDYECVPNIIRVMEKVHKDFADVIAEKGFTAQAGSYRLVFESYRTVKI